MPDNEMTTHNTAENLWPSDFKFDLDEIAPPIAVLKQQAGLLGQNTRNLVIGQVSSLPVADNGIQLNFYVIAPALSNYMIRLFFTTGSVTRLYPVNIYYEVLPQNQNGYINETIHNEADLKRALKRFFEHPVVHELLQSLIAQSVASSVG